MAAKIYALLVGINNYAPEVGKLAGCLNDVDHFQAYLTANFDKRDLAVEILKDSEATRDNIIKMFRTYLGKAKWNDVALFQYCGHGARWTAAKEFKEFYSDGWDEGLVCYDSRSQTSAYPFDLADKELAALLAEVAANNPHLAVILDCCHSGSATRDADAFLRLKARQTHEVKNERPLDSYLDGYYAKLQQKGEPLFIPASNHILLAACERRQKAYETEDCSGAFTSTLIEVLDKTGSDISYADLFVQCRAAVRKRVDNQTPQFETTVNFNAYAGFLGRAISKIPRRYSAYFEVDSWKIDAGALHGFPTEPEKNVALALYPEDDQSKLAGNASTTIVGPQKSELQLDFTGDRAVRYRAEITSLPVPPIPVYLEGDEKGKELLQQALDNDGSINVIFTDSAAGTRYSLSVEDGVFLLKQREMDLLIQGVKGMLLRDQGSTRLHYSEESAQKMLFILKHVVQWEKGLALQNHRTQIDASFVDFIFAESLDNGQEHIFPEGEIILDYVKSGSRWKEIRGKFKVRNRTQQIIHITFAYLSGAYGIHILRNEPIVPSEDYVTLWGDEPHDYFYLDKDEINESIENFKLIVSTEKVDDFLLSQDDLEIGRIISSQRAAGTIKPMKKYENDWFTKSLRVKVVRQLDQVSAKDVALADGKIVVKGHPSVKANLSLCAAKTLFHSGGDSFDFYKALERQGIEMLNFANTRRDHKNILELTDIKNAEALKAHPLELELDIPLEDDKEVLSLTFDGQQISRVGNAYKDENGKTHITIDHIPEATDNRRSRGKALKLYFFKNYPKQESVDKPPGWNITRLFRFLSRFGGSRSL